MRLIERVKEFVDGAVGKAGELVRKARETDRQGYLATKKEEVSFHEAEKGKAGWLSPAYSKSRTIRLDPRILADNRCVAALPNAKETESYKVLRTQVLQRMKEKGGNTLMITSATPGEGKTLTAINLACTMAKDFEQTVLLVDCDLRKQDIHGILGIESEKGLIDYLFDCCPISDLIMWPGIEKLTVISGGRIIKDSAELLGSPKMKDLVTDMKNRYPDRYVFFDVPPILAAADALAFMPMVDHVLLVVRAGITPLNDVKRALELIPAEKVLGLVLNRDRRPVKVY